MEVSKVKGLALVIIRFCLAAFLKIVDVDPRLCVEHLLKNSPLQKHVRMFRHTCIYIYRARYVKLPELWDGLGEPLWFQICVNSIFFSMFPGDV